MNKHVITIQDMPVKVYVNADDTRAILFPLFGRYIMITAESNVLDFTRDFILSANFNGQFIDTAISLEDTAIINIDSTAA
jgi:UDP-galactopyranose mutase